MPGTGNKFCDTIAAIDLIEPMIDDFVFQPPDGAYVNMRELQRQLKDHILKRRHGMEGAADVARRTGRT